MLRRSLMGTPVLYDVQTYAVSPRAFPICGAARVKSSLGADVIFTAGSLIFAGVLDSSVMLDVDWRGLTAGSGGWKASQEDI